MGGLVGCGQCWGLMPMGMWSTNISSLQLEPSGCYGFMGELGVLGVGPVPVAALQSQSPY